MAFRKCCKKHLLRHSVPHLISRTSTARVRLTENRNLLRVSTCELDSEQFGTQAICPISPCSFCPFTIAILEETNRILGTRHAVPG